LGRHRHGHSGTVVSASDIGVVWWGSGGGGREKDSQVPTAGTFVPIAVETLGLMNSVGLQFLSDLGRRITQVSTDHRESAFLFQRLSVLIQRFIAVAVRCNALTPTEDDF